MYILLEGETDVPGEPWVEQLSPQGFIYLFFQLFSIYFLLSGAVGHLKGVPKFLLEGTICCKQSRTDLKFNEIRQISLNLS